MTVGNNVVSRQRVFRQLIPEYIGTDYFRFYHKHCHDQNKTNDGDCIIKNLFIDNYGRINFQLKCSDCGFEEKLKTHFNLHQKGDGINLCEKIHVELSLLNKMRVKRSD